VEWTPTAHQQNAGAANDREEHPHLTPIRSTKWEATDSLKLFLPTRQRPKVDLSYIDPLKWQTEGKKPASASKRHSTSELGGKPQFRENRPVRRLLVTYMRLVETHLKGQDNAARLILSDGRVDAGLRETFSGEMLRELESRRYGVEDVAAWSWAFSSDSVDQAVARFVALSEHSRVRLPWFIPMQFLRAERVSKPSLKKLLGTVMRNLLRDPDLSKRNRKSYKILDDTAATILIIRLLRHARKVAPECLDDITTITQHLFTKFPVIKDAESGRGQFQRLTYFYNRLLLLMSLPTSKNPFQTIPIQQQAQMSLIRQMLIFTPQLPVTREGYRALLAVQVAHQKTEDERTWELAKAISWPPWRKARLGIEEDLEYPGQESRATKVLRRMAEAGYQHGEWDRAAGILAGWDTDESPTIQTRSIMTRPRMAWLRDRVSTEQTSAPTAPSSTSHVSGLEWAARIMATRTRREAWACFCSYQKSTEGAPPTFEPYHAMFQKLLARSLDRDMSTGVVPGDVKETFPEPIAARDMVYVETEPPSIEEFYGEMLGAGIPPSGRLLGALLDHATDLDSGLRYISDSSLGEIKKDVLVHAEKYPSGFIRETLAHVPDYLFAAYIGLLARSPASSHTKFTHPTSESEEVSPGKEEKDKDGMTTSFIYAHSMLTLSDTQYLPAWNAFLAGALAQLEADHLSRVRGTAPGRHQRTTQVWRYLEQSFLSRMQMSQLDPDFSTFGLASAIVQTLMLDRYSTVATPQYVSLVKAVFTHAAHGRTVDTWLPLDAGVVLGVPDAESLLRLVSILGASRDISGLLALLEWMNVYSATLLAGVAGKGQKEPVMRRLMIGIRVVLEHYRADEFLHVSEGIPTLTADQLHHAQRLCEPFGWATDKEMKASIYNWHRWTKKFWRMVELGLLKESKPAGIEELSHRQRPRADS